MGYHRLLELSAFACALLTTTPVWAQPGDTTAKPDTQQPSPGSVPDRPPLQRPQAPGTTPSHAVTPSAATLPPADPTPPGAEAGTVTPVTNPTSTVHSSANVGAQPSNDPLAPVNPPASSNAETASVAPANASDPRTPPQRALHLQPSFDRADDPDVRPPAPLGANPRDAGLGTSQRTRHASPFRPAHNPARLYFGTRLTQVMAGANPDDAMSGRAVVLRAEIGQTWNTIGYALGFTVMGSQFGWDRSSGNRERIYSLVGVGPSVGLGRLALLRNSFFDVRVAYDFLYGAVYRDVTATSTITPHGPRLDIDLGLLAHGAEKRRRRHALGATLGYQRLIGALSGAFTATSMISIGATYKFS
ncbi:MAG: hypothetical protein V3V08_21610 [Nannocystaceae bacterium]